MSKGLFLQNVIAIIWDFDKTLSPQYMQEPLFKRYDIDARQFWEEVRTLPYYYKKAGINVQPDTAYLSHILTYVQSGRMKDLSNTILEELGKEIEFYPGVPDIFDRLKAVVIEENYKLFDLHVEHYVVSTGLAAIIRGSAVARFLDGIWASEFIETPAPPGFKPEDSPSGGNAITQIAGFLDHTTKTRAIFEINKGVNKHPDEISVNDSIPEDERRVPIRNMIYIADGPSDIPSFSVIRKHGGLAYGVYQPESLEHLAQVDELLRTGRVDAYGPAEYSENSQTALWLQLQVRRIADRMVNERLQNLKENIAQSPQHS